jgi:CheY-like chemotaxis protein
MPSSPLPAVAATGDTPRASAAAAPAQSPMALRGARVLLVDDSSDLRRLISRFLERAGATIECAVDGREGVARALTGAHDLVLMDLQMPGLDGWEALSALRAAGYGAPIVALSASAEIDVRRGLGGRRDGFNGYLAKPFTGAQLLGVVGSFLGGERV